MPDVWGKTPLHYAAQRGSMISSIYLLKRGVDINKKDIYGNTPLGCALLYNHSNYAVVLMQNKCEISTLLTEPDVEKFKEEIEKNERQVCEHLGIEPKEEKKKEKKKEDMMEVDNDDDEEEVQSSDDDEEDEDYEDEEAWKPKKPNPNYLSTFGVPQPAPSTSSQQIWSSYFTKYKQITMFRTSIIRGWQGLAYMFLDMGFPITTAVQDAMDESRFQQVTNLLSKNPNNEDLQLLNGEG